MGNFFGNRIAQVGLVIIAVGALLFLNFGDYLIPPSNILEAKTINGQPLKIADGQPLFHVRDIEVMRQGESTTLVLTKSGDVYSNGSNVNGELGRGNFGGESVSLQHVTFPDGIKIARLDISQNHAVALDKNGDVWTWGKNMSGQLGDNTRENRNFPVKVLRDVKEIAAGYRFSAAIKKNGELWAWGMHCDPNMPGLDMLMQMFASDLSVGGGYYDGGGSTGEVECLNEQNLPIASLKPRKIDSTASFAHVSAGYGHILMIDDEQQVWGFGCNGWGQLGRGHNKNDVKTQRLAKSAFPGGAKISKISAGFRHSMAIDTNGQLWVWGHSNPGESIAYGTSKTESPQLVKQVGKVEDIDAGKDMSAIVKDNALYLVGDNKNGQLFPDIKAREWVIKSFKKVADDSPRFSLGEKQQYYWRG